MWRKIVYLTITLLISSCTYEIDCPGYPEKYLVWMPYIQGEEFSLTDGIDTFQLIVESTDITKAYTVKRSKLLKDWEYFCDCHATSTISSDFFPGIVYRSENKEDKAAEYFVTFYHEYPNTAQVFGFQDNNGDTIFATWPYQNCEILSSYDNGYKIFNDVLKIESDTLLLPEILLPDIIIYQIYIAKTVGIIQF